MWGAGGGAGPASLQEGGLRGLWSPLRDCSDARALPPAASPAALSPVPAERCSEQTREQRSRQGSQAEAATKVPRCSLPAGA